MVVYVFGKVGKLAPCHIAWALAATLCVPAMFALYVLNSRKTCTNHIQVLVKDKEKLMVIPATVVQLFRSMCLVIIVACDLSI